MSYNHSSSAYHRHRAFNQHHHGYGNHHRQPSEMPRESCSSSVGGDEVPSDSNSQYGDVFPTLSDGQQQQQQLQRLIVEVPSSVDKVMSFINLLRAQRVYFQLVDSSTWTANIHRHFAESQQCHAIEYNKLDWARVERRLSKDALGQTQQNESIRLGFRWDNVFLVKSRFTFGRRVPEPGTVHVIQTSAAPIIFYKLDEGRSSRFNAHHQPLSMNSNCRRSSSSSSGGRYRTTPAAEHFSPKGFSSYDQFMYDRFVLQPHSIYKVEPETVYVLLTCQKTLFSIDVVPRAMVDELEWQRIYMFASPTADRSLRPNASQGYVQNAPEATPVWRPQQQQQSGNNVHYYYDDDGEDRLKQQSRSLVKRPRGRPPLPSLQSSSKQSTQERQSTSMPKIDEIPCHQSTEAEKNLMDELFKDLLYEPVSPIPATPPTAVPEQQMMLIPSSTDPMQQQQQQQQQMVLMPNAAQQTQDHQQQQQQNLVTFIVQQATPPPSTCDSATNTETETSDSTTNTDELETFEAATNTDEMVTCEAATNTDDTEEKSNNNNNNNNKTGLGIARKRMLPPPSLDNNKRRKCCFSSRVEQKPLDLSTTRNQSVSTLRKQEVDLPPAPAKRYDEPDVHQVFSDDDSSSEDEHDCSEDEQPCESEEDDGMSDSLSSSPAAADISIENEILDFEMMSEDEAAVASIQEFDWTDAIEKDLLCV